jgi:hypothetical protein
MHDMYQSYDIVGDVHGHADALVALLKNMGYEKRNGAWRHFERQVIFVGDFIDRGPKEVQTVEIARDMVEAGSAQAIMGNHEFNAIAWYLPDSANPGDYLRSHFSQRSGAKNRHQHAAFLAEVEDKPQLHLEIVDWFLSLPLWLDLPRLRIVHACWHSRFMDYLAPMLLPEARLSKELMPVVTREPETEKEKDSPEPSPFKAAEMLTKGLEIPLPQGYSFRDKDGVERRRVRVRWWDNTATTYREAALVDDNSRKDLPELALTSHSCVHQESEKPVFIGHYWLTGTPELLSKKVACVDYSAGNGGPLCAYRWDGESILDANHFCWV